MAEVLTDKQSRALLWREGDEQFYPKGVNDPDYCVLRFTVRDLRLYHNMTSRDLAPVEEIHETNDQRSASMDRIESFEINHDTLAPGMYTSRIDGDVLTYDLRMAYPNSGKYLDNDEMHTFEHLFATYVRNSAHKEKIIYFGPMGCRTGFYFLVRDTLFPAGAINLVKETLDFIASYTGEIPGATPRECGNAAEHSLPKAVALARRMQDVLRHWTTNDLQYLE